MPVILVVGTLVLLGTQGLLLATVIAIAVAVIAGAASLLYATTWPATVACNQEQVIDSNLRACQQNYWDTVADPNSSAAQASAAKTAADASAVAAEDLRERINATASRQTFAGVVGAGVICIGAYMYPPLGFCVGAFIMLSRIFR